MPAFDLRGRVAVVTGAGRGLGREVAIALATHGSDVAICGRDGVALKETRTRIEQRGVRCVSIVADVSQAADVDALVREVASLGDASILVNAAGIFGPIDLIAKSDRDQWVQTLLTNTVGPYLTVRAFVGQMIDSGWGRIVNVSSAAAFYPPGPFNSAYATSKVALNQFTRHLAAELEETGVTANVLHPGSLKTAMWADIRSKVEAPGVDAEDLRQWVRLVDRTGGDSMDEAVRLVLRLIDPESHVQGAFCWPDGMLVSDPLPSW